MGLPSSLRNIKRRPGSGTPSSEPGARKEETAAANISKADLKRSTRVRRAFVTTASICYLLSWIFLVLVDVGNTRNRTVLRDLYFFKLDLSDILPLSVPNAVLINSIARTMGLHDFYQVGLWNFCEGYADTGITHCSEPQSMYWFNPVSIIMNELLSGASIALPNEVITLLDILRLVSHIMFGFFLTGTVLTFVLIFATPVVLYSRWWSLLFAFLSFLSMLLVAAASIIATAISLVFKYACESQSDLNIHAYVGVRMLVFMWLATGFSILAFAIHSGLGCCCTSRRDVKIGRRPVKAAGAGDKGQDEKNQENRGTDNEGSRGNGSES